LPSLTTWCQYSGAPASIDQAKRRQPTRRAAELAFPLLGLFGETGTLLSVVKKKQRFLRNHVGQEETMSGPSDVAGDQLRTIVERIENIEDEIKELTEAKKFILKPKEMASTSRFFEK
jgi:Uncharacterized protein conserved in bacteria (DUF2312)